MFNKLILRKMMKIQLSLMNLNEINQKSLIIQQKLIKTNEFQSSNHIGIYISKEREVSTSFLIDKIFEMNKKCFIPQIFDQDPLMRMVELYAFERNLLIPNKWKILQHKNPIPDGNSNSIFNN